MKIQAYDLHCRSEVDAALAEALVRHYRDKKGHRMEATVRFAFEKYFLEVSHFEEEQIDPFFWRQLGTFLGERAFVEFDNGTAIGWHHGRPYLNLFKNGSWRRVRELKEKR